MNPSPKDLAREYMRSLAGTPARLEDVSEASWWVYAFAYWIEGQDLADEPCSCRYHVVVGETTPELCPFEKEAPVEP